MKNPLRYFYSSPEVIRLTVMMYVRHPLSLRQVEDLLFERDIDPLASADDPFGPSGTNVHPIYRGAGLIPRFTGLANPKIIVDG